MNVPGILGLSRANLTLRALLLCALVGGCASAPSGPPTPITSVSQIQGQWEGTITIGFAGPQELYSITIHPDGAFVAQYGMNWQWGKVILGNGPASFEITAPGTSTGTLIYYAGPGRRTLDMNSTFGNWSVHVTRGD